MPGLAPPFERTPVDETRVRHLHDVAERDEPGWPPPERGVHRDVHQHPRVVEPAELPTCQEEGLAAFEQLLGTDPEAERTEDERAMQVDLDVDRPGACARWPCRTAPRTPAGARAAAARAPSVPTARTRARSRPSRPTDRRRRTIAGRSRGTSCARPTPPSGRRTRCPRRRTRPPGSRACAPRPGTTPSRPDARRAAPPPAPRSAGASRPPRSRPRDPSCARTGSA